MQVVQPRLIDWQIIRSDLDKQAILLLWRDSIGKGAVFVATDRGYFLLIRTQQPVCSLTEWCIRLAFVDHAEDGTGLGPFTDFH